MGTSINISVVGFVGGEPEVKTVGEQQVASFSVAVNRKTRSGEQTLWVRVSCWNGLVPVVQKYVHKGSLVQVQGYGGGAIRTGTAFGRPESGVRPAEGFDGLDAFTFVDRNNQPRYAPRDGTDAQTLNVAPLAAEEVQALLAEAIGLANRARAQIRRPLGSSARVTVSVVDSKGAILGMLRTRDAPVFGADVSLQKARTATLFSSRDAAAFLRGITEPAVYRNPDLSPKAEVLIPDYVDAAQAVIFLDLFIPTALLATPTALLVSHFAIMSGVFFPAGCSWIW